MPEFLTRIDVKHFNGRPTPCINGWHLYKDLALGSGHNDTGAQYYITVAASKRVVGASESPHKRALLDHISMLEKQYIARHN